MAEILDTPVGDFEWGPDGLTHRWRDRFSTGWAALAPAIAIGIGAALLTLGSALGWSALASPDAPEPTGLVAPHAPDRSPATTVD